MYSTESVPSKLEVAEESMLVADDHVMDDGALGRLYRRYSHWLAAAVRKKINREEAEDVVQETYLRLASYPAGTIFRHPKALLLKVASNIIYDHFRARGGSTLISTPNDPGRSDVSLGSTQYESYLLKQVVLSLPESYRTVFMLSRFGGLSYVEIARQCNLTVKSVDDHIGAACMALEVRTRVQAVAKSLELGLLAL